MKKTKTYKSDAFAAIHETAAGMYDAGVIDKQTMRSFDHSCLTPIHDFTPEQIRALREREEVSQSVFACYLNVSKDYVSKWERGEKKPAGPSLKLLSLIEKHGLEVIA
jgi:putative transcriptional regulator